MSDIGLLIVNNCIDLSLSDDGSTLFRDDGLESSILISLFTDQRVSESEVPQGESEQRGWWGDLVSETPGDKTGSKLWTLYRSKLVPGTAQSVQVRAKQALQWMIDDGVASSVDVVTTIDAGRLLIAVSITKPDNTENKFSMFWDGQNIKRA